MKPFVKKVCQFGLLAAGVSCLSVVTSVTFTGVLLAAFWYKIRKNLPKNENGEDKATGNAQNNDVRFLLHEAVIMRQLITSSSITTTWLDIGGCDEVLRHIREQVIYPLKYASSHPPEPLLMPPKGVLLYGPPGCGKTLIAKAIAKEVDANFLNVDVSTVKNMWVGETEKMAAAIFSVAYKIQPCIIFLDEVDTLLGTRHTMEGSANTGLKAIFLQMWDGLESDPKARIMVLAATNRRDDVDDAFMRRLPLQFEISLPSPEGRLAILTIMLRDVPLSDDVNLNELVEKTDGFSGSDLQELCRCAAARRLVEYMQQLSAGIEDCPNILRDMNNEDFMLALDLHRLKPKQGSVWPGFYV